MKFTVEYPIGSPGYDRAFLEPATMTRFVKAVEALGIDAIAFTEHPAPSKKWLDSGGHESFDPLTGLAYVAASTSTIKLMTYLLVLPYRNPLLAAKQIATTDVLSGGEAARILFCKLMLQKPNVLVLDEPTNHLDLESINALNIALQRYPGTVLLVTHDHDLIDEVATRIWHLEDHTIEDFKGTYDEYQTVQV